MNAGETALTNRLADLASNTTPAPSNLAPLALALTPSIQTIIDARLASYPVYSGTGPKPVTAGHPYLSASGVITIAS